jgi:hypothetical protein
MEKKELLNRWHELLNKPVIAGSGNEAAAHSVLQERLDILHRLNQLGQYEVEGVPIVQALEETNVLLRELDRDSAPLNPGAAVSTALGEVYGSK